MEQRCRHDMLEGQCALCASPRQYASPSDVLMDYAARSQRDMRAHRHVIAAEDSLIAGTRAARSPLEQALVRRVERIRALHEGRESA